MTFKVSRITALAILLGIALFVALVKMVPAFLDKDQIRLAIEKGLRESTGVNFGIQELTMESTLFNGIQVHLNTTTITDMDKDPLGNVDNISIQIRYLPLLLRRTPEIAKIHINHVYIPVAEHSLFSELRLKLEEPDRRGFIKPAELKDTEILLTDFLVEDLEVPSSARTLLPALNHRKVRQFRVEGKEVSIKHVKSNRPLSLLGQGTMVYTTGPGLQQAGERKDARLPVADFKVFAEVPKEIFDKGHQATAADVGRLNLDLNGDGLNLALRYRHQKNQAGIGNLDARHTNLSRTQAIGIQLGDTFALPLPDTLFKMYLAGFADIGDGFRLDFKPDPNHPRLTLSGRARLDRVAVIKPQAWPRPMLAGITGPVLMNGDVVTLQNVGFSLGDLPLRAAGTYNLNTGGLNLQAEGRNLKLDSLERTVAAMGGSTDALQGRDITGLVDFRARITGTDKNPAYWGQLAFRDGAFRDVSQGLALNHVSGRFNFDGHGAEHPVIAYNGTIQARNGKLIATKSNLAVNRFDGDIALAGRITEGPFVLPSLNGLVTVGDAQYRDPQTGLLVNRVHGLLRMVDSVVHVENFRAQLGSATLAASGMVTPNLNKPAASRYDIRVTGNDINLKRFKNEVLAKLPQARPLLAQLQPYSGTADLNLRVSTGAQLNGRIDVSDLAMATGMQEYGLRVPRLSVFFNNRRISVPDTTVYYGDIALKLAGSFSRPRSYNFTLNANTVPVSFLRDHEELFAMLSGSELPEIWNTSGSFGMQGRLSNTATSVILDFHDAGLSWRGGDFPLYGLNGRVMVKQAPKGRPLIATRDVRFRYGNSRITLEAQNDRQFSFNTRGILSALTVNHFLVSPQSEATPYREIPFRITAAGVLAALPGSGPAAKNDIVADLHLNLNRTLKNAYKEPESIPTPRRRNPAQPGPAGVETNVNSADLPETSEKGSPAENRPDMTAAAPDARRRIDIHPVAAVKDAIGLVREKVEAGINILRHPEEYREKTEAVAPPHPDVQTENPAAPPAEAVAPIVSQLGGDNAYIDTRIHLVGQDLQIEHAVAHLFEGGNLLVEGSVPNALDAERRTFDVRFFTSPEISLDKLSHGTAENDFFRKASGTVGMDVRLTGGAGGPQAVVGWMAANRVAIPYLTVQDLTGKFNFNGTAATAQIASFAIPGVAANASAGTENIFDSPMTLENVAIGGSMLSLASLADFNDNVVSPILVDQVAHNFARPWQQGDPTLPFQFRDARMHFDEAILQNIIISNLSGNLSMYANSFFELSNARLEAAGGQGTGYFSMHPNENNFMTLELNADNISANALTRALLGVTNQIFGVLSGQVRFTTSGADDKALISNANGTVNMKVRNGRLPAIAKVETLLTAANLIRGGLLNFNLNNLFRSLQFYESNYFAELSGDLLVANGVLYTENLVSDGTDLDLLIQGSLEMDDGDANMLIQGTMSQNVAGKLGPLGKLSMGNLIRWIPALGTFGNNRTGLLGYIPGVGYVPGLGGPAGETSQFQVRLVGDLNTPGAIQGFQWIRNPSL